MPSLRLNALPVAGITCIKPMALTGETASGSNSDSCRMSAATRNGSNPRSREVALNVPLVVRLEGTNVDLGKKILKTSGLKIVSGDNLADAAEKIVKAVKEAK